MKKISTNKNSKYISVILFCIFIFAGFFFFSCQKELSCEDCQSNRAPIAYAGKDTTIILPVDSVTFDGSASYDPDGSISSFAWRKISGPVSFNISNPSAAKTVTKTLTGGVYQFELKVTDNGGLSARDTMRVIVTDPSQPNRPPVTNAGPDQTITLPINHVNLDGSASTDPDNNITSYTWTKISGPASFNIANPNAVQTQVTNLVQGTYLFELKVTDAGGLFSKDTVQITVETGRPIINAQLIPIGNLSEPRAFLSAGTAGNKIVFAGGIGTGVSGPGDASSRVDIYDTVTHAWTITELSKPRWEMVSVSVDNKIFFSGGYDTDGTTFGVSYDNVDIYDATANLWSVNHLSEPRYLHSAAVLNNKVFFAGGHVWAAGSPTTGISYSAINVDIYDLSNNTWTTVPFPHPRMGMSATTAGNKIYFAGGFEFVTPQFINTNRIDIYDGNIWTKNSLNEAKARPASITSNGKIYWAGGGVNGAESASVEIRDINTQTSSFASLFEPNSRFSVLQKNNMLIFFTGWGAVNNKFDIYDITANTWSIGSLNMNIRDAVIITVNNTIYVAGGYVNGILSNQVWKLEF